MPTIEYVVMKTKAYSIFLGLVFLNLLEKTIILFESIVVHFINSDFHCSALTWLSQKITAFFLILCMTSIATNDFPAPQGNIMIPLLAFPSMNTFFKALS